jgi:aspartokinase
MSADVCENWTDVSGVYSADPNKFQHAARYEMLDYQELLSVAKSGAQVFHPEAIAPLEAANIPLKIMNTFAPHEGGTLVSKRSP